MVRLHPSKLLSLQTICLLVVASLLGVGLLHLRPANADQLPSRSLALSKASPSANDTYRLGFTIPNNEVLGSIKLQICAESPIFNSPCSPPAGLNLSAVQLASQSGITGLTVQGATANALVLGRAPGPATGGTINSYELRNVTNPSTQGTYYGRISTYASADASGTPTDAGGVAFAINSVVQISATVPPYLYFCVGITIAGVDCNTASGDYVSFGEFSSAVANVAASQMVAGTNADTGYNIVVNGTTLTSGNNIIPELDVPDVSRPGTSQFGINLLANQDPPVGHAPAGNGVGMPAAPYGQPNRYKFTPGDTVVTLPEPDAPRNYTVSYVANIARGQAPGVYVSTLTYLCTGGF